MISRVPAAVVATIGVVAFAAALASTAARADIEPQPTPAPDATPPQQAPPQLTKPPALTTRVDPIYPEAAQREGRGGDVVLVISIDASGAVTDARVETSSGSADLDAAALEAAKQLVFSPAEWDGVPGPVAIEYKMTFAPNATAPPPTPTAPPPPTEVPETTATASDATAAANVVGLVRAAVTKDPLADVEIALEDGSESPPTTSTGSDGKFALAVPVGKARLSFTKTGYEPSFVDVVVETGVRSTLVVTLDPKEGNAFETVVTRKRAQTEVSKVVLTRDEVAHVPGTFGDPLRVIENLPGLARAPFAGGALIVRGANPEDSGVYYDGVEIPVLYHFQGLKSVINAEFLDDISFYPGGFGAYYGRATAGIVDISSRTLDAKQPRGSVDVNLLDAGFFAAAPVSIGGLPTFTVAAAARRSYIDAFLPFVLDAVTPPGGQSIAVSPVYWDYQVKIESKPIPGQTFSLFAFGSDDAISLSANGLGNNLSLALGTDTQFHRLVGRWTSQVNDAVKNVMQPFVGTTSTSISVGTGTSAFGGDNGVTSFGLRDDLTFKAADAFVLRVGFDGFGESTQTALAAPLVSIDVNAFPGVNGG
ncbi:MAG TPA: TonB family protein, partial [Myxococcota bacterium]